MRVRIAIAAAALVALPISAAAFDPNGNGDRILASGKLDASNSYDFSCSVVNKNPENGKDSKDTVVACIEDCNGGDIEVTIELKDENGDVYINPSTFLPATLTVELGLGEAAMVTAPANFAGVTSLYCWSEVPHDATVFGTFLTRDAQDRATAATPLQEHMVGPMHEIHKTLTRMLEWGATTNGPKKSKKGKKSKKEIARLLASGKLDASNSYDFSCSLVNKNPDEEPNPCSSASIEDWEDGSFPFDLRLKDEDGNTYINPQTFQPAVLEGVLAPGEAVMVTAPAGFVGVTSLYCWADVPLHAHAFGTFLTRDAQDRSTAATPLKDDMPEILHRLHVRMKKAVCEKSGGNWSGHECIPE